VHEPGLDASQRKALEHVQHSGFAMSGGIQFLSFRNSFEFFV
jgi:hypothetical protein